MIAEILDSVQWSVRDGIEAPAHWSDRALAIVASRYLRPGHETSVRTLLERVATTLSQWVRDTGVADDGSDLTRALIDQRGAFNSPVWFNVGVDERPQCSACFILSVEDSLSSILDLARIEALLFQRGSGAGTNLSTLRSSHESLSEGGNASGPVSFMRGFDAFAGVVKSGGRTRRAAKMQILDVDHPDVLEFIRCKAREEKKAQALIAAGFGGGVDGEAIRSVAFQNTNLSVRVPAAFFEAKTWDLRAVTTGETIATVQPQAVLDEIAEAAWVCGDPGLQYADTIEAWNPCKQSGPIRASNPCSEFLFLDDTACNLASLNLRKYADPAAFCKDIRTFLTAMEAIVDRASYPTDAIATNSQRFRPLGLGYANLGALLMTEGLPYDSDAARARAAAITALLTGEAYAVSASLAVSLSVSSSGEFDAFAENRDCFLEVLHRHRAAAADLDGPWANEARAAWDRAVAGAEKHGVRNAQVTLLAPTGTIAFLMDCETTGIEPDLALVKYKHLVGGGTLRMVNRAVGDALRTLGYEPAPIVAYVEKHETIEGAPGLNASDLAVFDCAIAPPGGGRSIAPEGHLRMMAAVQPFLSGGISKTVNLAAETTPEQIAQLYRRGWELGLKALAVYREGSKGAEPLATQDHCWVEECGSCE